MNTRDSRLFGNILAKSLTPPSPLTGQEIEEIEREVQTEMESDILKAEGPGGVDPDRREAALLAWVKRERGHAEEMRRKAEAHRQAGEDDQARDAERSAAKADIRHQKKLHALEEHRAGRGQPPKTQVAGRLVAPKAPKPVPKPEPVAARAGAEQVAPPAKPAPKPVERKWGGNWEDVKAKHREERKRLHEAGFERVEVSPLEERGGIHVAREVLQHPDGRKVEHHVEYDPENDKGNLLSISHEAPKIEFVEGARGREIFGKWKVHLSHVGGNDLALPNEGAALDFAEKLPKDIDQLNNRMKKNPMQGAIGITWLVKDEKGENAGVWKHIKADRNFGGVPEVNRELANYRIAQSMNLGVAPPVVPLKQKMPDGNIGSHFMAFVKGATVAEKVPNKSEAVRDLDSLHELIALDVITGQPDRHEGNWMITKDGKAVSIDSGFAFAYGDKIAFHGITYGGSPLQVLSQKGATDQKAFDISPALKAKLKGISDKHIEDIMRPLGFEQAHIEGAKKRLRIVQNMTKLTRENFGEIARKMVA